MHHNTAAWSYVCSPAEQSEVRALATARHIAGTLFNHHRAHPAPELSTDAAVEEVVDEDPPHSIVCGDGFRRIPSVR